MLQMLLYYIHMSNHLLYQLISAGLKLDYEVIFFTYDTGTLYNLDRFLSYIEYAESL